MHFCFTGQYTPQALNGIMDNPTASRFEAAKNVIEAAGGKLISMYGMPADGPGVMVIFETPDQSAASAVSTVVVASGGTPQCEARAPHYPRRTRSDPPKGKQTAQCV